MHMSRHALRYIYFLGKGRLVEEENKVENEDESFSMKWLLIIVLVIRLVMI